MPSITNALNLKKIQPVENGISTMILSDEFKEVTTGDEWSFNGNVARLEFERGDKNITAFDEVNGKRCKFVQWIKACYPTDAKDRDFDIGTNLLHECENASARDLVKRFKTNLNANKQKRKQPNPGSIESKDNRNPKRSNAPKISSVTNSESTRNLVLPSFHPSVEVPAKSTKSIDVAIFEDIPSISTSIELSQDIPNVNTDMEIYNDSDWEEDTPIPWSEAAERFCENAIESDQIRKMKDEEQKLRTNMEILSTRLKQNEDINNQLVKIQKSMRIQMSFFYRCLVNGQDKLQKARKEVDRLQNEKEDKEIELKHANIKIQSQANRIQAYEIHAKSMTEIFTYCAHMSRQGTVASWPMPIEKPDHIQ